MSDDQNVKYFVGSILRFLQGQLDTQNLSSDAAESLEVSIQCLENAFNLDATSGNSSGTSDSPLSHIDLYDLFVNSCLNISPEKKAAADALKNEGNNLMKLEKYHEALSYYNRAINLDATNPVFYCNRAAAYSKIGELQKAIDDCKMSLRYDPNYSKAHGRLGLAYSKLNRHQEAIEAYRNALRIEPNNVDYQNNLAVTQERLNEIKLQAGPNVTSAASGIGVGVGVAGGGAEGIPGLPNLGNIDFAAALNNPTLVNLATRMMTEPGIQNLLVQLSGMNNMDALMETGRQLAASMYRENPDLISDIRQQFGQGTENPDGTPPNNTNVPPSDGNPPNDTTNKPREDGN